MGDDTYLLTLIEEWYLVIDVLKDYEDGGLRSQLLRAVILHSNREVVFLCSVDLEIY